MIILGFSSTGWIAIIPVEQLWRRFLMDTQGLTALGCLEEHMWAGIFSRYTNILCNYLCQTKIVQ